MLAKNDRVLINADDWALLGKIGTVADPEPVRGSTQVLVEIDGVKWTLAARDLEKVAA